MAEREWAGDWWLGASGPPSVGRTGAPWQRVFSAAGRELWRQEPAHGGAVPWVGAPWRETVQGATRRWHFGEVVAEEDGVPEGHGAAISWDGGSWRVAANRLGTLHAYRGPKAISSSYDAARQFSSGRVDATGLASFCAFGFFLDDRTHLDDVRVLPPATYWTASADDRDGAARYESWQARRAWQWPQRDSPSGARSRDASWAASRGGSAPASGFDAAVDELAAVLRQVLAEQGRGRVAVPISGGLDSRTTVALMPAPRGDDRRQYFTYGWGERSIEIRLAERLAAARGLPLRSFRIEGYLPERLDALDAILEGFVGVVQPRQAAVTPLLGESGEAVIAAHWGDVWLDGLGVRDGADLVDEALSRFRRRGASWLLDHVAVPVLGESREQLEERLREAVRAGLARLDGLEDPSWRLKVYKTEQWSHRWTTASLRAYQMGLFPRLPFYDCRVVDLASRLPDAWLAGRRLQIEVLRRHAPELARVTWQQSGLPLDAGPVRRALALPERAWRKAVRALRGERVIERNWEVQCLGPEGRRMLEDRLLAPGRAIHDLVDRDAIRRLLDRFAAEPRPETAFAVGQLLTLALCWERM